MTRPISKTIDQITQQDLRALISDAVREGREIEYKQQLNLTKESDKKEFLADVSSFANSGGGDLIIGMKAVDGVATELSASRIGNIDEEISRIENIIRAGLEPRIRCQIRPIDCGDESYAIVIRIEPNSLGPHRIIFGGYDRFYGRNSNGKYPLDVQELRSAFTSSVTARERIRAFRTDRILSISNNETPVPLRKGFKSVLHFIPIDAFTGDRRFDLLPLLEDVANVHPMLEGSLDRHFNLDGIVLFRVGNSPFTYTQIYRNGIMEVVDASFLTTVNEAGEWIASVPFEKNIVEYVPHCFEILKRMDVRLPLALGLALTNTQGLRLAWKVWNYRGKAATATNIIVPDGVVSEWTQPPGKILKPIFDIAWNAFGFAQSPNFTEEGKWKSP